MHSMEYNQLSHTWILMSCQNKEKYNTSTYCIRIRAKLQVFMWMRLIKDHKYLNLYKPWIAFRQRLTRHVPAQHMKHEQMPCSSAMLLIPAAVPKAAAPSPRVCVEELQWHTSAETSELSLHATSGYLPQHKTVFEQGLLMILKDYFRYYFQKKSQFLAFFSLYMTWHSLDKSPWCTQFTHQLNFSDRSDYSLTLDNVILDSITATIQMAYKQPCKNKSVYKTLPRKVICIIMNIAKIWIII